MLAPPDRALAALTGSTTARTSRAIRVDEASIGVALRCYVAVDGADDEDASHLRPGRVDVVVTGDYLLTLHDCGRPARDWRPRGAGRRPSRPSSPGSGSRCDRCPAAYADEEPSFDRLSEQVGRLLSSIDAAANGMRMLLDLQLNQRATW